MRWLGPTEAALGATCVCVALALLTSWPVGLLAAGVFLLLDRLT